LRNFHNLDAVRETQEIIPDLCDRKDLV